MNSKPVHLVLPGIAVTHLGGGVPDLENNRLLSDFLGGEELSCRRIRKLSTSSQSGMNLDEME